MSWTLNASAPSIDIIDRVDEQIALNGPASEDMKLIKPTIAAVAKANPDKEIIVNAAGGVNQNGLKGLSLNVTI